MDIWNNICLILLYEFPWKRIYLFPLVLAIKTRIIVNFKLQIIKFIQNIFYILNMYSNIFHSKKHLQISELIV